MLLSDILGTDEDIIYRDLEDETERKLLNAAIDRLNPREQKIVKLRFGLGREQEDEMTQKEVARPSGYLAVIHIEAGKEDYETPQERNFAAMRSIHQPISAGRNRPIRM